MTQPDKKCPKIILNHANQRRGFLILVMLHYGKKIRINEGDILKKLNEKASLVYEPKLLYNNNN